MITYDHLSQHCQHLNLRLLDPSIRKSWGLGILYQVRHCGKLKSLIWLEIWTWIRTLCILCTQWICDLCSCCPAVIPGQHIMTKANLDSTIPSENDGTIYGTYVNCLSILIFTVFTVLIFEQNLRRQLMSTELTTQPNVVNTTMKACSTSICARFAGPFFSTSSSACNFVNK